MTVGRGKQIRVKLTPEMLRRVKRVAAASGIPSLHLYSVSMGLGLRLLELALTSKPSSAGLSMETALAIKDEMKKHEANFKK